MPLDKEQLFLADLQRVNPSAATLYYARNPYNPYWGVQTECEQTNAVMDRVFEMARGITEEQAKDMIPLIAHHFGPDSVHREFFRNLKGGYFFYTTKTYHSFLRWYDYWEYELAFRNKIEKAFRCKMHDIFAFRSDIHPMDYVSHLRSLASSCSAFGFEAEGSGASTVILYFESEEDEILARLKLPELVFE